MNKVTSQTQGLTKVNSLQASGILQRKCACGNKTIAGGECEACGKNRLNLQRRAVDSRCEHAEVPPIVHDVLRSPGQPLDAETRTFMEPRFAHDFSQVRVHTDAKASESAQAVNALAYTVGRDVVFGAGQYRPLERFGQRVLAHELAHVVQQRHLTTVGMLQSAVLHPSNEDRFEHEAEAASEQVSKGGRAHGLSVAWRGGLQRQPAPAPPPPQPPPAPATSCVQDGTDKQLNLASGTVTVIDYWATWCPPCLAPKAALEKVCNEFSSTKTAVPVRFFSVDCTDDTKNKKTSPPLPVPLSLPTISVFIGATRVPANPLTAEDIKAQIQSAIAAAKTQTPAPTSPAQTPAPTPPAQTPAPTPTRPDPATCKDPPVPPCVFKPVIKGPTVLSVPPLNLKAADPIDATQTQKCGPQLFTLDTTNDTTRNTKINHVQWRKLPPAKTRSVIRTASDNEGDAPAATAVGGKVGLKVPSYASLNPTQTPLNSQSGCTATGDKPVWCVAFCSFGEFQMEAWVTWECDPNCLKQTDVAHAGPFKINVTVAPTTPP